MDAAMVRLLGGWRTTMLAQWGGWGVKGRLGALDSVGEVRGLDTLDVLGALVGSLGALWAVCGRVWVHTSYDRTPTGTPSALPSRTHVWRTADGALRAEADV